MALILAAVLVAALSAAASRLAILVVDLPEQRATLVLKRSAVPGLRGLDTTGAVCERQGPGSPLHSIYLGTAFCEKAVTMEGMAAGENVYLRLPFSARLQALADDHRGRATPARP
jgi:hypothetical protein